MKATLKYFWVVTALILVQIFMGAITAHYGVEGLGFYSLPLADVLPYSISRTWHIQLAVFWIATSWLVTGLFIAPAVSGKEPKYQKLGVNFLFIALLVIVVGSLAGQWMAVMQKLALVQNFWGDCRNCQCTVFHHIFFSWAVLLAPSTTYTSPGPHRSTGSGIHFQCPVSGIAEIHGFRSIQQSEIKQVK